MTTPDSLPTAPHAAKVPTTRTFHGDSVEDPYEWLRDRDSEDVLAHLRAEDAYSEAMTVDLAPLRAEIFEEIKGRTQETDLSVPSRKGDWWYYARTQEGEQYAIHCRVPARTTGDELADWTPPRIESSEDERSGALPGEQILLDGNAEAADLPFFSLGALAVSDDGNLLAYAIDGKGDERFTLRCKDLRTGEVLPDVVEGVFYSVVFSPAGDRVYYLVVDATWRPHEIRCHRIGTDPTDDSVVYREDEQGLWLGFGRSSDHRTLVIESGCAEYSESRLLDLENPDATPELMISRTERILHDVDPVTIDGREMILLVHDRDAPNSMVSLVAREQAGRALSEQTWTTVIPHRDDVRVQGLAMTATHIAVSVRENTIPQVTILPIAGLGSAEQSLGFAPAFDEELYDCSIVGARHESPCIRLAYSSFVTPSRIYDFFPAKDELVLRKESPVRGGYDPENYVATREWADAHDGTRIPISIVRRADLDPAHLPVLQYAYGSYEISMDPGFSIPRLSVLDRGVAFVIAHVRGGGELGRSWYERGKKLEKTNTFTDFVAVTDHIVATGLADPQRIAALGGSAGGLLMGAVANLAPEKYCAIVAQVPFVDPLTSILDPELPLSALEWEEWGNPITDPDVYAYMKGYSPYENVAERDYPPIAAVTSLNDTRVLYVEPAKWVARLRESTTGAAPVIMKIEMDGGHGGASGRYAAWKDRAWDYAFTLGHLGARKALP